MRPYRILFSLAFIFYSVSAFSQLLYPESYVIIFDTTKHFKGIVAPSIEVKTPKELYIEINNTTNLAYRFKNHGIVLANKFEFTKNGNETILSGGFLYLKFKTFYDNPLVLENYVQYQWAEARGLQNKYAIGTNLRYKLYKNATGGVFAGLGPFLEHEEWNYQGVPDKRLPAETDPITQRYVKWNFYLSTQMTLSKKIKGEAAIYVQDDFENFLVTPRIGWSNGVSYQISEGIAFAVQFRMLYDYEPVVPVDKLWFNAFTELQVTF